MKVSRIAAAAFAIVAVSVTLAACTQAPEPQPTSTGTSATQTPTTEPTPEPTPEPTAEPAVFPFAGDCLNVLPQNTLDGNGLQTGVRVTDQLTTGFQASAAAAMASLGGFTCTWAASGQEYPAFSVTLVPDTAVTAEVRTKNADLIAGSCEEYGGSCVGLYREAAGVAIYMSADIVLPNGVNPLETFLDDIVQRAAQFPAPVPPKPAADKWSLGTSCDAVQSRVATVTGWADLQPGIPTDNIGHGIFQDILSANGVEQWCAASGSGAMVFITIQPGVGAVTADVAAAATAAPITVGGADAAYTYVWGHEQLTTPRTFVVASVGSNRVTVGVSDPSGAVDMAALTAAVLSEVAP